LICDKFTFHLLNYFVEMKRVKLLQIAVYIVFAAFFFQDAAADFYKGFTDGYTHGVGKLGNSAIETIVIPDARIDNRITGRIINGDMKINDNYQLEGVSIFADVRVNASLINKPLWLNAINWILVFGQVFLLGWIAWLINKIIDCIYAAAIFEYTSLRMIRQAGFLFIAYAVANYIYVQEDFFSNKYLVNSPVTMVNSSTFNFGMLLCGLLVLIIAEAFNQGAHLKREQDLTI